MSDLLYLLKELTELIKHLLALSYQYLLQTIRDVKRESKNTRAKTTLVRGYAYSLIIILYAVLTIIVKSVYYVFVYPILNILSFLAHMVPFAFSALGYVYGFLWLSGYTIISIGILVLSMGEDGSAWGLAWLIPFNIIAAIIFGILFVIRQAIIQIAKLIGPIGAFILIFVIGFGDDVFDVDFDGDVGDFPDWGLGFGAEGSMLGVPMAGDFLPSVTDFSSSLPDFSEQAPLEDVSGYTRADGIHVDDYARTVADGNPNNNLIK